MSDLVGNPEDRFSQNEAHFAYVRFSHDTAKFKYFIVICIALTSFQMKCGLQNHHR